MRKHAIINNGKVTKIQSITEDEYQHLIRENEAIWDIEDLNPQPQEGWEVDGNKLVPGVEIEEDPDKLDAIQQTAQRIFGEQLVKIAIDKIGAKNLKLSREGTPANVAELAAQLQNIKLLLEGGALKTTRTLCGILKPSFPLHEDILQSIMDDITNFLIENGWN